MEILFIKALIIYENSLKNNYILTFSNLNDFKKSGSFGKKARQKQRDPILKKTSCQFFLVF